MNKTEIITKNTDKFLSEVLKELPSNCLLNKGITGCGGTTLEIKSKRNSLILVPTINLVLNKTKAHENLIGVYGSTTKDNFNKRLSRKNTYKKIIATYDSLDKVIEWVGNDIYDYFLLIDEYHILFNSYAFRYNAITKVLNAFRKFKNYCFMTATPLKEDTILEEIKDLDVVEIKWPQAIPVKATLENVYFTSKKVLDLIEESKNQNWNLHIFINSVTTIRKIVKTINVDYRVVCSNVNKSKNLKLNFADINSEVKKVNFYTSTAFEGVDIYDPIGKTVVVSDTSISSTLMDISTLFVQICGRLRDSIYKDQIMFICNTKSHRYLKYTSKEKFLEYSKELELDAIEYEEDYVDRKNSVKKTDLGLYDNNPSGYHDIYLGKKNNNLIYDPNLKSLDIQNYEIIANVFNCTTSVITNVNATNQIKIEEVVVKPIFKEIYEVLPKLVLTSEEIDLYLKPIWKEYRYKSNSSKHKILDECSSRKRRCITKKEDGEKIKEYTTVYDFTELKLMLKVG